MATFLQFEMDPDFDYEPQPDLASILSRAAAAGVQPVRNTPMTC